MESREEAIILRAMSPPRRRSLPLVSADPPGTPAPDSSAPEGGLSRRAALQGLAGSLGAALAAGTAASSAAAESAHPIEGHVAQRAKTGATKAPIGTAATPFLDAHQLALLTRLCDLIVPGSVASRSPQYIDEVLAIERPEVQQRFVGALSAFDAAAREQHRQPFTALIRERQMALLEAAEGPESGTGRDLQHLKTWIAGAHYSSEPGMKELGFTGGMFFASFPACTHQDGHQ
jgi:hypothetical protein